MEPRPELIEIEFRFSDGKNTVMKHPEAVTSYLKKDFDEWFVDRRHVVKYAKKLELGILDENISDTGLNPDVYTINTARLVLDWLKMFFKITDEEL